MANETDFVAVDLSYLDPILAMYADQPGSLIQILQGAQDVYGYLPADVLQRIADRLGVALGKVYGVATFYSQFYLERRGRHVLKVCDGTACHVQGAAALADAVSSEYGIEPGETTADGELTTEIVYCLGSCALAPVTVLNDQVMGKMRPEDLLRRIKQSLQASPKSGA